jgi:hypothetical protein
MTAPIEKPDLIEEARNILRALHMDHEHLVMVGQNLVKSHEVIKRAQAALIESGALLKQTGGTEKRTEEARKVVQEYANDQRQLLENLRKKLQ